MRERLITPWPAGPGDAAAPGRNSPLWNPVAVQAALLQQIAISPTYHAYSGAKIVRLGRTVNFRLADVAMPRRLLPRILRSIDGKRPKGGVDGTRPLHRRVGL